LTTIIVQTQAHIKCNYEFFSISNKSMFLVVSDFHQFGTASFCIYESSIVPCTTCKCYYELVQVNHLNSSQWISWSLQRLFSAWLFRQELVQTGRFKNTVQTGRSSIRREYFKLKLNSVFQKWIQFYIFVKYCCVFVCTDAKLPDKYQNGKQTRQQNANLSSKFKTQISVSILRW